MDYIDYLSSKDWLTKAEKCKERAGYKCQVCNSSDKIQVHHRTYERLGQELPEDLTVLCDKCHRLFHSRGRIGLFINPSNLYKFPQEIPY